VLTLDDLKVELPANTAAPGRAAPPTSAEEAAAPGEPPFSSQLASAIYMSLSAAGSVGLWSEAGWRPAHGASARPVR
jgi:hypothetical protein